MVTAALAAIGPGIATIHEAVRSILSNPALLAFWALLVGASVGTLWWDVRRRNRALPSLMKGVWTLVVVYSGPFGLAAYWYAGRTQITHDSLWRRGIRSTAHCYSGCGAGEVVGVLLAQAILGLTVGWVTAVTFAFAYVFGYSLTVGPLVQEGVSFREAATDALYSETPSITVMEIVAIGADQVVGANATVVEPLFWAALALSLSLGFVAAFPVNVGLVRTGVKEGMANPAAIES